MSDETSNGCSISELESKIIKQIEYYFGDKNLPRDRFLRQKIDEDKEGWVSLECLLTFNRLKSLCPEAELIANAVKKSSAGLVQVSEDNTKVRRNPSQQLPQDTAEARLEAKNKTVYCKPFPKDIEMASLEAFFAKHGKVVYIMMRKDKDKKFKGSVFVEFSTQEEAKEFLTLESLKYEEEELIRKSKEVYFKDKSEEIKKKREDENRNKKIEKDEKEKEKNAAKEAEKEAKLKYNPGCVLSFENVGEQTSREDLKELFGPHEEIAWVDFARGETKGHIRFTNEGGAQKAIDAVKDANDGKVVIRDVESTVRVLEGDEERDYWKKVNEDKEKLRSKNAGKRFGKDKKQWWKGKRKAGGDGEEPPQKVKKD